MDLINYSEFSKHIYSLLDVLDFAKNNNYDCGECKPHEIYYAYVGRDDQDNTFDKGPCLIAEDFGNKALVYKITSKDNKSPYRYRIKNIDDLSLNGNNYIRLDDKPYLINKDWITMFVGELTEDDMRNVIDLLTKKNNHEKI